MRFRTVFAIGSLAVVTLFSVVAGCGGDDGSLLVLDAGITTTTAAVGAATELPPLPERPVPPGGSGTPVGTGSGSATSSGGSPPSTAGGSSQESAGFEDVEPGRYFREPVQWMVDNGVANAATPACFAPYEPVTRGETATFIWRMEGEPEPVGAHPFSDVVVAWQQDPVSWMASTGITTGTSPTTFAPDETLTRGQLAALLHRLAGEPSARRPPEFVDVVRQWQVVPVGWMVQEEITTGTSPTTFSPESLVTKGQLAAFLHRYEGSPTVEVGLSPSLCPDDSVS